MKPISTPDTNHNYVLPGGTRANDLPCHRVRAGLILSEWDLTKAERLAIARGGRVELGIHTEPIPPVQLHVVMRDAEGGIEYVEAKGPCSEPLTPAELAGGDALHLARTIAHNHGAHLVSAAMLKSYTDDALELRDLKRALDEMRARSWWRKALGLSPRGRHA